MARTGANEGYGYRYKVIGPVERDFNLVADSETGCLDAPMCISAGCHVWRDHLHIPFNAEIQRWTGRAVVSPVTDYR